MLSRWTTCGFALLLLLGRSFVSADSLGDWESMREQQQRHYDAMIANMKLIEQTRMNEVMQLHLEKGNLIVRTPLPSTGSINFVRVHLLGISQYALLRIQGGNDNAPEVVARRPGSTADTTVSPANFQLSMMDYSHPQIISTLSVTMQPSFLNISKQVQFPTGYRSVQIMEQDPSADSGPGGTLQLNVNASSAGASPQLSFTLEAENFPAFVSRYPRESSQYLRPLLRELGQEAVFAPDPLVAWQVFSDNWKAKPDVVAKVQQLLPAMDHPDYRVRERAVIQLEALGRDGATALIHLDRTQLSLEQQLRIDRALAPYATLSTKEAERLRSDPGFLLDCLYCDEPEMRRAALSRYRAVIKADPHIDLDAEADVRASVIAAQREKLLPTPTTSQSNDSAAQTPQVP